ncbi:LysE family translocator [Amycolatopsis endophytica]|uniref:Threonine/homoserine/homoserine lactone efflux protein n=1 Tax=Amycolatopsis endophytica TaxID=860233 RepID=A0A853AX05_9PSEU|nr:LysE family translocator [Amycolatopsis endophytica]NYI87198.1 threonine/homoserine/homoserine lactone efflux protein [Amycolatopsis endophytica]
MSFEFLLTALVVVATPGTGALLTMSAGLAHGTRASAIAALGCTLGIVPHAVAAITGLAALLHTSAVAFQAIKYAGVAYLLYLAWSALREKDQPPEAPAPRSAVRVIVSAVLVNVLNPKLTLFFFAFLPQFVYTADPHSLLTMIELSGVFMALTLVVFLGYGAGAAAMRDRVLSRPRVRAWMRRVFAGTFVALAARLAAE